MTALAPNGGRSQLSEALADLQECLVLGQISQEEHDDLRRQALEAFSRRLHQSSACGSPACSSPQLGGRHSREVAPAVEALRDSRGSRESATPSPQPSLGERSKSMHRQLSARGLKQLVEDAADEGAPREDEADFWCKWMKRRSVAPSKSSGKQCLNQATVHDIIDVTAGRLDEIFDRFDTDQDGQLDHRELATALASQGFDIDEASAAELARHVLEMSGQSSSSMVTVREFDTMMTRLRLAELFTPYAGIFQWTQHDGPTTSPVSLCDYNHSLVQFHTNMGERPDFFFGWQRPLVQPHASNDSQLGTGRIVRWVHVDAARGLDRLRLLRLAVKYHLHPVHVDDVIDNRAPSKFECTEKDYFISADILTLAQDSSGGQSRGPGRVRIHRSHVSIFLSGSQEWDTLLTIHQDRPDESSWLAMWRRGKSPPVSSARDVWESLRKDLQQQPPRRMREEGADFLLYEVLNHIVVELRPIADAYAQRLAYMYQGSFRHFPQAWLTELGELELELTDLSRSIRPNRQLIRHLIGDHRIRSNTRIHLEDVDDAVAEMMEDLSQLQQMAKYLQEAHERRVDKKMNDTLFVLSLISAIFLPAQFITGLYGMNFEYGGQPAIPELTWETGYVWFWVWQGVALLTAILVVYLVSIGCRPCLPLIASCSRCCSCCTRRTRVHAMERSRTAVEPEPEKF